MNLEDKLELKEKEIEYIWEIVFQRTDKLTELEKENELLKEALKSANIIVDRYEKEKENEY